MAHRLVAALAVAAAAAGLATPAPAVSTDRIAPLAALERAEGIFDGSPLRPTDGATLALRDLTLVLDRLPPEARRRAEALLDRPDDPAGARGGAVRYTVPSTRFCTAHFCLHYVRTTNDAPPLADANANGTPEWVEANAAVLEELWQKEVVEYGFRAPKPDLTLANHGPDARFDVYLAEIVDRGVLGFCAPEPPPNYQLFDVPGYCVLDNDYSPAQIGAPGLSGLPEMKITAVHEFFHAIQFGYDYTEDVWLLEGTATWVEDAVYDDINEPYRRFPYSALRQPHRPLDFASRTEPFQYGSWVFWRFLEELLAPPATQVDPGVIRRVWEWVDGGLGAPDYYSLQAVEATLAERSIAFAPAFLSFAVANFIPGSFYREGASWPSAPLARTAVPRPGRPVRGAFALDHLSSRYVAFVPPRSAGRSARLSLTLDLPPAATGSDAAAIVFRRRGASAVRAIPVSITGDGQITLPFGRGAVRRIVLVLTNASTRYACGALTFYSCRGRPQDDGRRFAYTARLR